MLCMFCFIATTLQFIAACEQDINILKHELWQKGVAAKWSLFLFMDLFHLAMKLMIV